MMTVTVIVTMTCSESDSCSRKIVRMIDSENDRNKRRG
jgi:hypothetical protein